MSGVAITTAGTDLERCAAQGRLVRLPGLRGAAPSLVTLVRLATATDQSAGGRGAFVPCGERADIRTLVERSPYRRMTALVRLLALAAGTDAESGLTLDLPVGLLDRQFGRGRVVHFEDIDFPAVLTHEPTRRFLRETGLPEQAFPLTLDTDAPLPTLEEYAEDAPAGPALLPADAERLIRVGGLAEQGSSLVLDGTTGTLLKWSEPDAALHPLSTDVSTLAFTLWLLHRAVAETAGGGR
ncbi:SUKH-4 family immunity protein [Streptomyces sp. NPDC051207]|uniref:SUKH-4 family immunity protein n=1 Tax=Streptomyces sp. NPDC051207 TaxID=3154641 RepID=UPI00341ABA63